MYIFSKEDYLNLTDKSKNIIFFKRYSKTQINRPNIENLQTQSLAPVSSLSHLLSDFISFMALNTTPLPIANKFISLVQTSSMKFIQLLIKHFCLYFQKAPRAPSVKNRVPNISPTCPTETFFISMEATPNYRAKNIEFTLLLSPYYNPHPNCQETLLVLLAKHTRIQPLLIISTATFLI